MLASFPGSPRVRMKDRKEAHFSILQATEIWVRPGSEARWLPGGRKSLVKALAALRPRFDYQQLAAFSFICCHCIKSDLSSGVLWHLASSQLSLAGQGGPAGSFCSTPQCASCVGISVCIPLAPHTKDLKQCLSQSSQSAPSEITSGEHTRHYSSQWPTSVEHHQALNRIEKGVID